MWAVERVHLLGKGRAEKEREGVTSHMLLPSPGIYFSTEYMGRVAGSMVPKTCRAKGVYVWCLSVRPLAGHDARSCAALPWEPRFQEQLQGSWVFQLVLLSEASSPKASCTWCESSFPHGGHLLWLFGSHSIRCTTESTSVGKDNTWQVSSGSWRGELELLPPFSHSLSQSSEKGSFGAMCWEQQEGEPRGEGLRYRCCSRAVCRVVRAVHGGC